MKRTIDVEDEVWAVVDRVASEMHCEYSGQPSITKLIRRIGSGEVILTEMKSAEAEKPVDDSGDSGCRWKDGSVVTNKQLAEFKANNYNYGKGFTPDAYVSDGYKK